jgi:hypothetical protein
VAPRTRSSVTPVRSEVDAHPRFRSVSGKVMRSTAKKRSQMEEVVYQYVAARRSKIGMASPLNFTCRTN